MSLRGTESRSNLGDEAISAHEGQPQVGCWLPALSADEERVLEMRAMLVRLRGLLDPGTVLEMYGAGRDDLELLAVIEEELKDDRD